MVLPLFLETPKLIISKEILGCFWRFPWFPELMLMVYDERNFKKGGWSMNLKFLWPTWYTVPGGECIWINDVELLIISFRVLFGTFHFFFWIVILWGKFYLGETPATQDASSQLSLITMDSAISACGTVGLWSQAAQLLSATLFTGSHNENLYTNAIRSPRAPKHL